MFLNLKASCSPVSHEACSVRPAAQPQHELQLQEKSLWAKKAKPEQSPEAEESSDGGCSKARLSARESFEEPPRTRARLSPRRMARMLATNLKLEAFGGAV